MLHILHGEIYASVEYGVETVFVTRAEGRCWRCWSELDIWTIMGDRWFKGQDGDGDVVIEMHGREHCAEFGVSITA